MLMMQENTRTPPTPLTPIGIDRLTHTGLIHTAPTHAYFTGRPRFDEG